MSEERERYFVDVDEWYPVFSLLPQGVWGDVGNASLVDLTPEEIEDYNQNRKSFHEWQERLAKWTDFT